MADVTLGVTGGAGLVSPGSLIPNRAVGLSGWFSPSVWLSGVVGAGASGTVVYGTGGGSDYSWLLVDRANRLIDWSYAGVPGGIKTRTTEHVVAGLYGDDSHNDYTVLAAAITACPEGEVVKINADGIFRCNSALVINKGITLRGNGPGTVLKGYSSGNPCVLQLGSSSAYTFSATGVAINSGYTKGSTSIVVASASGFTNGHLMLMDQLNDGTIVSKHGSGGDATYVDRSNGDRAMRQLVRITGISGTTISFSPPMFYTFTAGLSPQACCLSNINTLAADGGGVGIENLTIYDYGGDNSNCWSVSAKCLINSWMHKVYLKNCAAGHILTMHALQNTFRKVYIDTNYEITPSHAYGFEISDGSCSNLIEDSIVYRTSAEYTIENGAAGNVVAYNYGESTGLDNNTTAELPVLQPSHGAHPYYNLFEGNDATNETADDLHGSASHNMFFRNWIHGWESGMTSERFCVYIDTMMAYHSVIGNTLGVPGQTFTYQNLYPQSHNDSTLLIYYLGYSEGSFTTGLEANFLRHGNFDYANNAVVWDGSISSHSIPSSLYLTLKPAWMGSYVWPAIGPDVSGYAQPIPAAVRLANYKASGNLADLFADAA